MCWFFVVLFSLSFGEEGLPKFPKSAVSGKALVNTDPSIVPLNVVD
jgi:hypothetical protein